MAHNKKLKKWQAEAYEKASGYIKRALIEAKEPLTKWQLHKITGLSRVTINKHLCDMVNITKEVYQIDGRYVWGAKYRALITCLKADEQIIESLEEACNSLDSIVKKMSTPTNIWRWKQQSVFPNEEIFDKGYITGEEFKELLDHKSRVFGSLRRSFFDLAKILMKVDVGVITAEEDLSNVEVHFWNKEPMWTVYPPGWRPIKD